MNKSIIRAVFIALVSAICLSPGVFGRVPTDSIIARIGEDVYSADVQIASSEKNWQMLYGYADSLNHGRIVVTRISSDYEDEFYPYVSAVEIGVVIDGKYTKLTNKEVQHTGAVCRLRLRTLDGRTSITAGDKTPIVKESSESVYTLPAGSAILFRDNDSKANLAVERCTLKEYVPAPQYPLSYEDLIGKIKVSADSTEGVWEYLDRAMPDDRTVLLGGRYKIATVANGANSYNIVYLSGDLSGFGVWAPMHVRGHLKGTSFAGNYDLSWTDVRRKTVYADECFAQLSADNQLLTLSFPLLDTSIRFRRVPIDSGK